MPKDLDARLRRRARALKLSYSEAARQALQAGLREEAGVNMLTALDEFAGVVSGPEDLSTNRNHLADFGGRRKCPKPNLGSSTFSNAPADDCMWESPETSPRVSPSIAEARFGGHRESFRQCW